ncbi:MAG: hypothetical protein AAFX81_18495 [Pseudomonadota bacterium]
MNGTPSPPRDLLRAQLEGRAPRRAGLVGRLTRWLSADARAVERLDAELSCSRQQQFQELQRLRVLLDEQLDGAVASVVAQGRRAGEL